jgi:hypothetical protein
MIPKLPQLIQDEIDRKGGVRGGWRANSGRPRGSKNKLTKEAKSKERTVKERVLKNLDSLINAQLTLAKGQNFLYEIKMKNVGDRRKPVHVLVTDQKKIKAFLDGELEGEYFYVTSKEPDSKAIDSLLDRAFGRASATQTTDHNFTFEVINYENQLTGAKEDIDSIQLPPETIPVRTTIVTPEVQDSSVVQTIREIEDSSEQSDTQGVN